MCLSSCTCEPYYRRLYVVDIQMNVSYDAEVRFEIRQKKIEGGIAQDFIGSYSTAVLRFPQPPSS